MSAFKSFASLLAPIFRGLDFVKSTKGWRGLVLIYTTIAVIVEPINAIVKFKKRLTTLIPKLIKAFGPVATPATQG